MLLVADVGNTHIVFGIYEGKDLVRHWRVSTRLDRTDDEYCIVLSELFRIEGISPKKVEGVIISSVVPPVEGGLMRAARKFAQVQPLKVGPGLKTGMEIRYANPKEVGADRIVNAVAAFEQIGKPAIVVDFGTATTFDLVGEEGEYRGGVIAPGLGLSMEALYEKTAKLPRIDLARPKKIIGRDTVSAMQSGLYWGYVGMVDGILKRMIRESGLKEAHVLATGGLAQVIGRESKWIETIDEYLTLTGLRVIYERNQ